MEEMNPSEQAEQSGFYEKEKPLSQTLSRGVAAVMILLACVTVASFFYGYHKAQQVSQMVAAQADVTKRLDQANNQLAALTQEVSALQAKPSPFEPARTKSLAITKAIPSTLHRTPSEETRLRKMQEQIAANQQSIDKARSDFEGELNSTRGDLNGSIAKTHEELVALSKHGEQNYYEFDLNKSKQFTREGPVSLALRKTNDKHQYYDLDLLVNDSKLSKQHVNLYEPVWIYSEGDGRPVELVVNQIGKDHVHGYVSAPKYSQRDLAENAESQPLSSSTVGEATKRQQLQEGGKAVEH